MKQINVIAAIVMICSGGLLAQSPGDSLLKFSLSEAQKYALENSPVIKNAVLDIVDKNKKRGSYGEKQRVDPEKQARSGRNMLRGSRGPGPIHDGFPS